MLCQKCGRLEAIIHKEEVVYRQKIEQHLCALCGGVGDWSPKPWSPFADERFIGTVTGVSTAGTSAELRPAGAVLLSIPEYVVQLYAKDSQYGTLMLSAPKQFRILVTRHFESLAVMAFVLQGDFRVERELSIRDLFQRQGIAAHSLPVLDFAYQLPGTAAVTVGLLFGVLIKCLNVRENDPLNINFRISRSSKEG